MRRSVYVQTAEIMHPNRTHHYRIPVTDTIPAGEEVTGVRPAGVFPMASLLSPSSMDVLRVVKFSGR